MVLNDLKPNAIWQHFESINSIPRASTKEEEIIQFMIAFGNSLGLETIVDHIGNVIIKKPASAGKENHKTVVLQGHLDMVHQKVAGSKFDFATQGIEMYIDGDWVKAKETTLGADNGIGSAAIMAVLSSKDLVHPPIEALFTIDEEMGMTGAMALTNKQLKGKILLNLDSEEDDEITIGCAGGADVEIKGTYATETLNAAAYEMQTITVGNLTGGHSGVDIHLNRANAIKVMAECLQELTAKLECRIQSVHGGTLTNVIPRDCSAVIAIPTTELDEFISELKVLESKRRQQYAATDSALTITTTKTATTLSVMSKDAHDYLLSGLLSIPNGVYRVTPKMPDLVQTSNSISIIKLEGGRYTIACHARSSVDKERLEIIETITGIFNESDVLEIGPYPIGNLALIVSFYMRQ
ncbi:beta-Ala-His dipeptidase [Zobellia laminariae]|uniref:beta-Ala-His dipeptidase n=1 Tax=Zobellia laminariae TaxID=248906 RepID=UPI0026F4128F|nr:beta-Ala-His dipeptidase [Zobellia laminariae]WKX77828.1 beta-Ala-His dipeptidase [Zobellia laminariae]